MKIKTQKIFISIVTLIIGILAFCIGLWLIGESELDKGIRIICQACFMFVPLFIIQMIIIMFRKEE